MTPGTFNAVQEFAWTHPWILPIAFWAPVIIVALALLFGLGMYLWCASNQW
jgi:hypothetical protein